MQSHGYSRDNLFCPPEGLQDNLQEIQEAAERCTWLLQFLFVFVVLGVEPGAFALNCIPNIFKIFLLRQCLTNWLNYLNGLKFSILLTQPPRVMMLQAWTTTPNLINTSLCSNLPSLLPLGKISAYIFALSLTELLDIFKLQIVQIPVCCQLCGMGIYFPHSLVCFAST